MKTSIKNTRRLLQRLCATVSLTIAFALPSPPVIAQNVDLPEGFSETTIATDIQTPVGMEISPDGRLFVLAGNVRRIEIFDDTGYLNEFIRLPQALGRGSGLLGLEFAPDFDTTGDVYIAYITDTDEVSGPQRFRLSRFDSNGTTANVNSEEIIFEVDDIDPSQQQHQGGDIVIGDDGKIYWALGDRVEGSRVSQQLDSLYGKLLRLNIDGTIPTDNPFYADLNGEFRAIYANGLRNPFRMDKRLATGEIFMSEVGPLDWEELNRAEAGANYGWPRVSGVANDPDYTDPVFAYNHMPDGCAITGGAFYEPQVNQFPAEYHDKFFYGDHCFGWIAYHDLETGTDIRFMAGADRLVEVKVSSVTGALYYLDREYAGDTSGAHGGIGRIDFAGGTIPLNITRQPSSVIASVGEDVTFNVRVTGQTPFAFQWFQNEDVLEGEINQSLTIENAQPGDSGSEFYVEITDVNGIMESSNTATLTIGANTAPVAVITEPDLEAFYVAGAEYTFAGTATDEEDGVLDASAFEWKIVFHHDEHTHPFIPEVNNVKSGTFVPPTNDETAPDVWYRIHLTVTDSAGASTTVKQDIFPLHSFVTVESAPAGLELLIDGALQSPPIDFKGVAGVARQLEAPETQVIDGEIWTFSSWSNGGARSQTINTPLFDTTYTATYVLDPSGEELPPVAGLSSPAHNSTVAAPVTISGVATDEIGVSRVQVVIKEVGTRNYWNGSTFVSGWRRIDAELDNPNSAVTPWSYTLSPQEDMELKVIVRAWDLDRAKGDNETIEFSVSTDNLPPTPVEPSIDITSPEHLASVNNPVTIVGTAQLANLNAVKLIIKEKGARNYWNGNAWQSDRIEINASLTGGDWTYDLDQPNPRDVVVRAVASNGSETRLLSKRVTINID